MDEVVLNKIEIELARRTAKRRYMSNREGGVDDSKIGPQSNYQTDVQGMLAEIAAAKYLNVYPDLKIENTAGGVDLLVPGLGTIDVKATTYSSGHLLAPMWKQERDHADLYLLVYIDKDDAHIYMVGWVYAETLFNQKNVKDFGHGETFAVSQEDLHPPARIRL